MFRIDSTTILTLIPIIFVGIVAIALIGSLDERTRGNKIAKFFSIASNAAIFFTVLALLFQVVDSQKKSQNDAYTELLDTYYKLGQMQLENPSMFKVIYPSSEYNQIGNDEKMAIQYTFGVFEFFDRVYMMYLDGDIDNATWNQWSAWIEYSFTNSSFIMDTWRGSCGIYHAEFIAYIEQNFDAAACRSAVNQVDAPPGARTATPTGSPVGPSQRR